MEDLIFIFCLIIIAPAIAFIVCATAKLHSNCRQVDQLASTVDNTICDYKRHLDDLSQEFHDFMNVMTDDEDRCALMTSHIERLKGEAAELRKRCEKYREAGENLACANNAVLHDTACLSEKSNELRRKIQEEQKHLSELQNRVDSLTDVKEGLEIALGNLPAEEIPYLSNPLNSLGINSSIQDKLNARGIVYIGDLITYDEQYLIDIWGVGPVTIDIIKTKLAENYLDFGLKTVRLNNKWYRSKRNQ